MLSRLSFLLALNVKELDGSGFIDKLTQEYRVK